MLSSKQHNRSALFCKAYACMNIHVYTICIAYIYVTMHHNTNTKSQPLILREDLKRVKQVNQVNLEIFILSERSILRLHYS